jgi:hypothetical protein
MSFFNTLNKIFNANPLEIKKQETVKEVKKKIISTDVVESEYYIKICVVGAPNVGIN